MENHERRQVVLARCLDPPPAQFVENDLLDARQIGLGIAFRLGGAGAFLLNRLLVLTQLHFLFATQDRPGQRSQFQCAVRIVVHHDQPQRNRLTKNGAPLLFAVVAADAKGRQLVVLPLLNLVGIDPAQHIKHMHRTEALINAVYRGQQFLYRHRGVERHRRRLAGVAITARCRRLAEVFQQAHAPAIQRLAQSQHGVELDALYPLEGFVGFGFFDHATLLNHVLQAVGHPGIGRGAIAAGATGFLIIAFDAFRQIKVRDEAHIGLVDAHPERDGGHHHDGFLAQETRLVPGAFGEIHAGVIRQRRNALTAQEFGRLFDFFARQAVDDAGVACMFGLDEIEYLLATVGFFDDLIMDVGAIERGDELPGVVELQTGDDFIARLLVGGGGQRNARHVRKAFVQHGQLDVFRPEVMPPLRHAMRFVDGKQRNLRGLEQIEAARRHQALRCDIDQVDAAGAHQALDARRFFVGLGRIQERGAHAQFGQRIHLILHQCDQRRDDHADAIAQQGGNLVTQGLAAAGGHEHQRIAT